MASTASNSSIESSVAWKALASHVSKIDQPRSHLRHLIQDRQRYACLVAEHDGVFMDFSRQRVEAQTMDLLFDLAETSNVLEKIRAMREGEHINTTEDRAVMHVALRANKDDTYYVDGKNVVPQVHEVLAHIRQFSEQVRQGEWKGVTGQAITDVVAIGIGGSYLGAKFVSEALRTDPEAAKLANGRRLRFLSNVDPVAVSLALEGLNPATTLVVIISKTFTTAETMLNARTVRNWLVTSLSSENKEAQDKEEGEWAKLIVSRHIVAVSTNLELVSQFGIDPANTFGFWDWVGGRYSVTSAVGLLPLALQYGFEVVEQFLAGCRSIDHNFFTATPRNNLPLILGLLGVWNTSFLHYPARALIPYSEALSEFAAHIQQVDMESNGKHVALNGDGVPRDCHGEIDFGVPGTNSQHSFFQLLHQGRVVPVDFIGFIQSQHPIEGKDEAVSNHDELMANFFAQPDALAVGKSEAELKAEQVSEALIAHKAMPGNRPSTVILLEKLGAYQIGQLLAMYEHRTAVQGFVWNLNSFDQFGVELGKVLANKVRSHIIQQRSSEEEEAANASQKNNQAAFNPSTDALLQRYLRSRSAQ